MLTEKVQNIVSTCANAIVEAVNQEMIARVESVFGNVGRNVKGGRNAVVLATLGRKPFKKQLCPVPNCKNPAAPVYGMVCGKHKDVPKSQIKKYRDARRAKLAKKAA